MTALAGAALVVVATSAPPNSPAAHDHPSVATDAAVSGAAVPGTGSTLVQGATDLGPVTGSNQMDVTLALPLRDQSALNLVFQAEYTRSNPGYHHFLTPASFDARFAPTQASVDQVTQWATQDGLDVVSVSSNRTLVEVSGTAAELSTALGTSFARYRTADGISYVTPTSSAILPAALASQVSALVGLSTLGRLGVSAPVATPAATSYDPAQVASLYNSPSGDLGGGQTIADINDGALGQVTQDLSTFETDLGLRHVPVTVVPVGTQSGDTSSQTEWDLDAQYSTGLAPNVSRLIIYDAHSLSDTDVLDALNSWVTQDKAKEAGLSGGECEAVAVADGALGATDAALEQAVAQGQTLFVASGDQGAFCEPLKAGGSSKGVGVMYPASSQYAVSVGGTTVLSTNPLSEAAWPGSGGGISTVVKEPSYQLAGVGPTKRRAVPDVSLDGDPGTGFACIVNGKAEVIGGTSAGTQAWVGIWARTQSAHGGNLGFANIAIYAEPASAFHDVTIGSNGHYSATPGYDPVTGRGTPDIAAFIKGA